MLDVGFSEILLTSAIALIVLGPERLPKVARQVGNWIGRARVMARQLSEQLEREVNAEELLKIQSKSNSAAKSPAAGLDPAGNGAAFDPSYTPTIAPPTASTPPPAPAPPSAAEPSSAVAPPAADAPSAAAAPPSADAPPAASAPHPVYGLAASATTAAAMHASDPVNPPPPHE
jgi:sec-independent protein translocase protein TatB